MRTLLAFIAALFLSSALAPQAAQAQIGAPINCAKLLGTGSASTLVTGVFGVVMAGASNCTTAAAQVAGDHNTVYIGYNNSSSVTSGCTDLAGNAYVIHPGTVYDGMVVDLASADNIAAYSGNAITCSLSASVTARFLYAEESSGVALSNSFDSLVTGTVGTGTQSASKSITTSVGGEQIVMYIDGAATVGAVTPGSPSTTPASTAAFAAGYTPTASGAGSSESTENQVAGTAGAYIATILWTNAVNVPYVVAAFKPQIQPPIGTPFNCAQLLGSGSSTTLVTGAFGTVASGCVTAAAQTAGDHNTVYIGYGVASGGSVTTGCSDTAGNTYVVKVGTVYDGSVVDLAYADNIASSSGNVVTCTLSTSETNRWLYAEESSGVALSNSFDNMVTGTVVNSIHSAAASIATTQSGEQIVMYLNGAATLGAVTPGSPSTSPASTGAFTLGYNPGASGSGSSEATESQIAGAAGTYSTSFLWTNNVYVPYLVAAFKAAAGGVTAAASNVRVLGATATQVALSYNAPSAAACTLAVSPSASLAPLVNDLITDSTLDLSRASTIAFGLSRTVVVGKQNALLSNINGYNTQRISGALQALTPYFYSITCGSMVASGQFTTANIPLGLGYGPPWPTDPSVPGAWANPSSPGLISNEQFIDPQTGVAVQRLTYPGVGYASGTQTLAGVGTAYNQGQLPCDSAGPWTTPCNATGTSGYSSVTGSTLPIVLRPDTITSNWGDSIACENDSTCGNYLQQIQVNITGYCTSSTSTRCQLGVNLSENAGASAATALPKFVTLPCCASGAAATVSTPVTVTAGSMGIDPWIYDTSPKITLYDSYQYQGTATVSGSTVTYASGTTTQNNPLAFNSTWTTGGQGRIRFSNVSKTDACSTQAGNSSAEATIASGFGRSLTLTSSPAFTTPYYCAQDFAVMVNRIVSDAASSVNIQGITISYVSDLPGSWIDSGDPTIVAHNSIGGGYLTEIPTGGGYAQLSWVYPPTGYIQVLGNMYVPAKSTGANTWAAQGCPLMTPEIFIAIDDTQTTPTWYCLIVDGAGKYAILQVVYTGACCTTSSPSNFFANGASIASGSPISTTDYAVTYSNLTITDLTPSSLSADLGTLMTAFIGGPIQIPAAQPTTTCAGGPVQLGNLAVYCNFGQDTMGWLFAISPGNFNPVNAGTTGLHIIGSLNTWGNGASKYSGWHVIQDYGQDNPYFGYSPEPLSPNQSGIGSTAIQASSSTAVPAAGVSCATWGNPLGVTGNACMDLVINANGSSANKYEPYYWTSAGAQGNSPGIPATAAVGDVFCLSENGSVGQVSQSITAGAGTSTSITLTVGSTAGFILGSGITVSGVTAPSGCNSAGCYNVAGASLIAMTGTTLTYGSTQNPSTWVSGGTVAMNSSCGWSNLAQEYMMLLQKGVSGDNSQWIVRRGPFNQPLSPLASGTYTSGGTLSGSGTCTLTAFSGGGIGAIGTIAVPATGGETITFSNNGNGYGRTASTAILTNGSGGTCSGTASIGTVLSTTPDTSPKYLLFLPSSFSNQAGVPGWGGMYVNSAGQTIPYTDQIPSPLYGLNVLWNYAGDPNGLVPFTDPESQGGHSFQRPTQAVAASTLPYSPQTQTYNVRHAANFTALEAAPIGITSANPSFQNVTGAAQTNVYQAHPGMSGEGASPYEGQAAFDVRPLVGQGTSPPASGPYQPFTSVSGNVWVNTWTGGNYTDVDDFGAVHRKIYATAASAGTHPLVDISGPASNISTGNSYTFCVTRAAGECYAGSSVGQIYVNVPGVFAPYCYGNPVDGQSYPQLNDLCITDSTPLGQGGVQFSTLTGDPLGSFQRVLTRTMNGATHNTSGFGNIHALPDNSWLMFQGNYLDGISRNDYMAQALPYPPLSSVSRNALIPIPVILNPPAALSVNNAIVQFGYAEYGGNCTTRADACFANAAAIPNTNFPFLYASETPAGLSCSSGCTITIPAISQRILYYTVIYRNASNVVIATQPTQVLVTP